MRTKRQLISLLLMLALLLGMIPGVAVSALAEEIEIEGDLPLDTGEGMLTDLDLGQIKTAPALRTGAAPTETGTAKDFLSSENGPLETDVSNLNSTNWMSGIRGDAYLNDFNIPYTHDAAMKDYIYHWGTQSSGNFFGQGSYAKTQYLYIPEQLEAGVRILDLRLNNRYEAGYWGLTGKYYVQKDDGWNLYLCHGKNPSGGTFWAEDSDGEYVTFERVLKYVKNFLYEHPTETVILELSIETQDNDKYGDEVADRAQFFIGNMLLETNPNTGKRYLYTEEYDRHQYSWWEVPYTHMPQLKDCRGQAVIMYQAHQFEGMVGGMKRSIVGDVDILGGSNSASDSNKYEALVNDYVEGGPNDLTLPMPGEHRNLLRIVDTNSHADGFWDYVLVAIDDMHPLAIADYVHPKVFGDGLLLSKVGKYYGWVKMDGATERDCSYVWKTNFPTYTDYSTITVDPGDASDPTNAACYANYGTQTWSMPTGSWVTLPEDIYDVREHTQNKQEIPYLEYWMVTDSEGVPLGQYQPGESFKLDRDVTIKAVYHNTGKQWNIRLNWLDCNNVDGLRPNDLKVVCTYKGTDGATEETTLTIASRSEVIYSGKRYYWTTRFTGDLIDVRPVWSRIPTGDGADQGIDSEEYYRYNIKADLGDSWSTNNDQWVYSEKDWVNINLIHTTVANNTRSVSGVISWDDHDDADHVRPAEVTLRLYDEGNDTGRSLVVKPVKTVDEEEDVETTSWKWEFEDCTAYRDGRAINYTVEEGYIPEYTAQQERIGSLNILNWHNTTQTVKRIEIEWDDEDNKEKIRPNSVYVNLLARKKGETEYETLAGKDIISSDWYDTFTLWGKDFSDLEYDLTEEPVDGYTTTVEYYGEIYDEHGNATKVYPETYDGAPDQVRWIYKVTNKLIGIPKPSVLEGVYKSGYVEGENNNIQGDLISFDQGTYIATGDTGDPVRMTGAWEVRWSGYEGGKHHFTLGEQDVYISDTEGSRPWGIQVIGGSGTEEAPYTFKALHLEPVSYFEASLYGSRVKYTEKVCTEYTSVSDVTPENGQLVLSGTAEKPGWYVVDKNVYTNADLIIRGNVHLILMHNTHLYTDGDYSTHYDMRVEDGAKLYIYKERRDGVGVIEALYKGITVGNGAEIILHDGVINPQCAPGNEAPGIGGNGTGKLTVYGGAVQAEADTAAIQNMDIHAYGGRITADTKDGGLGISGGSITTYGDVKVYEGIQLGSNADADKILEKDEIGDYPRKQDMTIRAGHNHLFVFESDGATITATCVGSGDGCSLADQDKKVSFTLVPPTRKVYNDAGDPNATIDNGETFSQAAGEEISIKYYKPENGAWSVLTQAPDEVGTYKAEVALPGVVTSYTPSDGVNSAQSTTGTVSAVVYYTIGKATVEITTPPTASEITYGQTLADSNNFTVAVVNPNIEGTFTWANPRIQPAVIDSETTKYTVIFTPTDADNYETATCEVTVKVNPADPGATAPIVNSPLVYTGEAQNLITQGSAEHGVMLYALDNQPETDEGWQNRVPTATDAGEYKVWYKVFGDANYSDTEPASVTAKIEKADASGTVTGIEGLVYNTTEQSLVIPGEHEGGDLQYFVGADKPTDENQWENEIPAETNAGDYTVWYRVKGDGNHNNTDAASVVVNIAKAVVKVSKPPVASAITYGQKLENSTLTGGEVEPSVPGDFAWTDDTIKPAVADSAKTQYEVTFVPKDSNNYEAEADKSYATVVVVPADPTVTPPTVNSPLVYTGEAQDLITEGSATNGTMKYALGKTAPADEAEWSESVPTGTEAGDYIVWYKVFGDTNNYNGTGAAPLYVTIYPAQSGAVTPDTLVYNGEEQKLVVPGTVVGGTLQYYVGDAAPTDASQWKYDIPTRTDAGDYKVWYRVKGDANHNDGVPGSVTATIARAPITPGVTITGWTYGEAANDPAVTGNPGNGEVTVTYSAEKEGTYTTAVPTQAGSWFVKAEVAETKNYQAGTAYPVSFAIAKVNVSIFADNKSGIYGDALQTLTWRLGGKTVNGDDLGVSLSTTAKADSAPGDYPITVKWGEDSNYNATVVDGVYTIGKRPVTVVAGDQTVREDEQIATGVDHATATGLVEGHVLSAVTLAANGSAIQASGAKIVDAVGADVTANYAVSYAAGKLNVQQPGTPVVFPPAAKELTYNGKAQALVSAGKAEGGTMQYSADNKTWSENIPTGTDAGEYTVWYRVKGDADHGDVAASSLKVTIAKASIAPVVTITGWTYGDKANAPALKGNPGKGEVTYLYGAEKDGAYTKTVPTQAGSWFVKAEVAETSNYESGTADPVGFAIAKVSVSIFADNKSGVYGDALQTLTWRFGEKTVNGDDLGISLTTTAKADSAPGDYPITVKWSGNANYSAIVKDGVYTIGKRPVTVAAGDQTIRSGGKIATGVDHATATGLAEGHKLSAVTLAADGSAIKASGAKIVDAKGTDVTANYAVSYAAGKLNVLEPGTPAVFPPAAKELTYNGKAQALVTAGKAEGGTMQYSADNKTWSEKLPTGTDAGEYTVWYRVKGDADHRDVAASSLKVTIAKAAPKVTAPTAEELTYTGNAQALVTAGEVEGGKLLYSTDKKTWSEEIPTGTKAGGYDVYYKVEGDKNHSDVAAKRVKVTIAERKASPDYTLLAKMTTSGSTKLKLSWSKVQGAQGYDVFFKNCDGKQNYTRVTITSERSYTITGLKKRKAYKAYVVAWKKSGDRKYYIGDASPIVHAITGGYTSKQCNAKSVKLSKSSLTLKVGKSETLKTSVKGVKSGRKVLQHARLVRYYSSDANVAKVNKNGKITAVGKGSCTVYAVANNGVRSKVTVKVN